MEMTELRLGNLVMYNNQIVKTTDLHYDMFACRSLDDNEWMCTGRISEIQPIELTEEVLLKIGFEKIELVEKKLYMYYKEVRIDNYSYMLDFRVMPKDECIVLYVMKKEDDEVDYFTIFYNYNIKYLHQLQNAYFILTGEELEVKL